MHSRHSFIFITIAHTHTIERIKAKLLLLLLVANFKTKKKLHNARDVACKKSEQAAAAWKKERNCATHELNLKNNKKEKFVWKKTVMMVTYFLCRLFKKCLLIIYYNTECTALIHNCAGSSTFIASLNFCTKKKYSSWPSEHSAMAVKTIRNLKFMMG